MSTAPTTSTLKPRSLILIAEEDHDLSMDTARVVTKDGEVDIELVELSLGYILRQLLYLRKRDATSQPDATWLEERAREILTGKKEGTVSPVDGTKEQCYVVGSIAERDAKIQELKAAYLSGGVMTGTETSIRSSKPLPEQKTAFQAYLRSVRSQQTA